MNSPEIVFVLFLVYLSVKYLISQYLINIVVYAFNTDTKFRRFRKLEKPAQKWLLTELSKVFCWLTGWKHRLMSPDASA